MSGERRVLVLRNSEWGRGGGAGMGQLLHENGRRCCVGILGRELGVADEHLNVGPVIHITDTEARNKFPQQLLDSAVSGPLYEANDRTFDGCGLVDDIRRVETLRHLFHQLTSPGAPNGWELEYRENE